MTPAVVRSVGTSRRLAAVQEHEDFEQEPVDQFLLAGVRARLAHSTVHSKAGRSRSSSIS
ncbi:hypothetical protein ACWC9Q_35910 [Streptomyces sp. NPDC001142]